MCSIRYYYLYIFRFCFFLSENEHVFRIVLSFILNEIFRFRDFSICLYNLFTLNIMNTMLVLN